MLATRPPTTSTTNSAPPLRRFPPRPLHTFWRPRILFYLGDTKGLDIIHDTARISACHLFKTDLIDEYEHRFKEFPLRGVGPETVGAKYICQCVSVVWVGSVGLQVNELCAMLSLHRTPREKSHLGIFLAYERITPLGESPLFVHCLWYGCSDLCGSGDPKAVLAGGRGYKYMVRLIQYGCSLGDEFDE